jgi:hypothetical protein
MADRIAVLSQRLLAPIMKAWLVSVENALADIPRPTDPPLAHAPGHHADRILLYGTGPAAGWGVTTHDLALPGAVARAVAARTGRGSSVKLLLHDRVNSSIAPLRHVHLSRFDAVVVVFGVNEALQLSSAEQWRLHLSELLDEAASRSLGGALVVAGIPAIRGIPVFNTVLGGLAARHAGELNRITAEICAARSNTIFVPLETAHRTTEERERHRSPSEYKFWANPIAAALAPMLDERFAISNAAESDAVTARAVSTEISVTDVNSIEMSRRKLDKAKALQVVLDAERRALAAERNRLVMERDALAAEKSAHARISEAAKAEQRRQKSVDKLQLERGTSDQRLQQIVSLAQRVFRTQSAVFTLLDNDTQVHVAVSGRDMADVPRSMSFCDFTIREDEAMIVRDAKEDPRFAENPMVVGEPFVRFYAGFPIEAPSGERIGALCVVDTAPRPPLDEVNVDLLRELALRVQRELWRFMPEARVELEA